MSDTRKSRRWIILALVAVGIAAVAMLPRGASEEAQKPSPDPVPPQEAAAPRDVAPTGKPDGGLASRRMFENCDPIEESLKYEDFIGRRALAILSWNGMSEKAANLEIPVQVVAIEDGSVGVRFMQFPMRAQYLGIWLGSEHIRAGEKDVFLLDPCSATIIEWTAMERAGATEDDLDEDELLNDELLDDE